MHAKRDKTEIKYKSNLIYDSKLKDNDTRLKMKKKTYNVTQIHTRNDPIDCQIKGFLFRDLEDKIRHSRGDFSLFLTKS